MNEYDEDFIMACKERVSDDSIKDAEDQDGYTNMEVGLPRGPDGELVNAVVKKRARAMKLNSKMVLWKLYRQMY